MTFLSNLKLPSPPSQDLQVGGRHLESIAKCTAANEWRSHPGGRSILPVRDFWPSTSKKSMIPFLKRAIVRCLIRTSDHSCCDFIKVRSWIIPRFSWLGRVDSAFMKLASSSQDSWSSKEPTNQYRPPHPPYHQVSPSMNTRQDVTVSRVQGICLQVMDRWVFRVEREIPITYKWEFKLRLSRRGVSLSKQRLTTFSIQWCHLLYFANFSYPSLWSFALKAWYQRGY